MKKRRTPYSAQNKRITPEAIAAWEAGDRLALHAALRLHPGYPSPLEVAPGIRCPWPEGRAGNLGLQAALDLRVELMRLVGPPRLSRTT